VKPPLCSASNRTDGGGKTKLANRRAGASAAAALLGAAALLWFGPASAANRWGADYFPNVPLVTQDGTTVHLYDDLLKGKVVAVNLIYTRCKDECPLETAKLVQVQRLLGEHAGKDVFFYSISIDPNHDTPEVLKAYADKFGAGPGWLFLTGKNENIKLVTRKLGLSRRNDAASRDGHAASLMLGNEPAGQWMRDSAVDNPGFLAVKIADIAGWRQQNPGRSYAEAAKLSVPDRAEYLFANLCSACHSVGEGGKLGPDLLGVTTRRDRTWLARYVEEPETMLAEGDPIATALFRKYHSVRMPNLNLARDDIALLLSYIEARSSTPRQPTSKESVSSR
jgi:protein SCO1/2